MADNPNVGPEPVDAKPNTYREKTHKPSNPPKEVQHEKSKLSEATTRRETAKDMDKATDEVKKRL